MFHGRRRRVTVTVNFGSKTQQRHVHLVVRVLPTVPLGWTDLEHKLDLLRDSKERTHGGINWTLVCAIYARCSPVRLVPIQAIVIIYFFFSLWGCHYNIFLAGYHYNLWLTGNPTKYIIWSLIHYSGVCYLAYHGEGNGRLRPNPILLSMRTVKPCFFWAS
jgi:hypothetical protein